ncbi:MULTISPECIES: hypothetical protein [Herbaspirillum]|uniref:Uncharacterized protein n=2 Tax=Herbaspirillum huttiense TaxID=863372 RepID=A0AAJ2HDM4_9BURK|nr:MULTISPECIES: hypothetical protein [Herbaspirillum]MDR9836835.1 hypothetical protein [Herbaspirillum huttiense]
MNNPITQPNEILINHFKGTVDLHRVASSIKKLFNAASQHTGRDCYTIADLGRKLLLREGIQSARLVVGFAGWRVGDGDADVISHIMMPGQRFQPASLPYHAWIEVDDNELPGKKVLIDFSTYSLPTKARMLDELDGGKTDVAWSPAFLVATEDQVSSYEETARLNAGKFFYVRIPQLEDFMKKDYTPCDADFAALQMIYANPDAQVCGLNHTS